MRERDRVHYISGNWGASSYNPLYGTEHECVGTIIGVTEERHDSMVYDVEWDNGEQNNYDFDDLRIAVEVKPVVLDEDLFTL